MNHPVMIGRQFDQSFLEHYAIDTQGLYWCRTQGSQGRDLTDWLDEEIERDKLRSLLGAGISVRVFHLVNPCDEVYLRLRWGEYFVPNTLCSMATWYPKLDIISAARAA